MFSLKDFCEMCPTHLCLDKNMNIIHSGSFLQSELDLSIHDSIQLTTIFELIEPENEKVSFNSVKRNADVFYILRSKKTFKKCNKKAYYDALVLKGPMILINNGENLLYLGSPYVKNAKELRRSQLYLSDMALNDMTRELIMLNQSSSCQIFVNEKLTETMTVKRNLTSKLAFQKERNLNLLNEFLPQVIVEKRLRENSDFAEHYPLATCMIANVAFFDVILNNCIAKEVFHLVTDLFKIFDRLVDLHKCYKVASMMESYFIIANVPTKDEDHAARILNLAIGFLMESKQIIVPTLNIPIMLNIVVHTGSVMAGLVGQTIIRYCIVGEGFDVVKSLIKIGGMPGQIVVTNATKQLVSKSAQNEYEFSNNGYMQIRKNLATCTFLLEKNNKKTVWEIVHHPQAEGSSIDGYDELHQNKLLDWIVLEKNIQRQQDVIALMRNKPIPVNTWALKRLRYSRMSKKVSSVVSVDSGISVSSATERSYNSEGNQQNSSKACLIM